MNLEEYSKYDALGLAELVKKGEVTKEELASLAQQGLNKLETANKYGEKKVHEWRRGYKTKPPLVEINSKYDHYFK